METLVKTYAEKLVRAGLSAAGPALAPVVGGLDDALVWNRAAPETPLLESVFSGLNINSLVWLRPSEPYAEMIRVLAGHALGIAPGATLPAETAQGRIQPRDCETRTFLHDLPVLPFFHPRTVIQILKRRKSVIIAFPDPSDPESPPAVLAHGSVSPEQGFVTVSSVCFACFVKFFADLLETLRIRAAGDSGLDKALNRTGSLDLSRALFSLDRIRHRLKRPDAGLSGFPKAPFQTEASVYEAVIHAGRITVATDLVDSYFGNVSYCWKDVLYISQTGSSLDHLSGCIDPVPLDLSTSAGLTASSELSAHLETIERTRCSAILHGHPKFSVILSMDCDPLEKQACRFRDACHIRCPKERRVCGSPIVPGEVGTGPFGLCNTLPKALEKSDSAIVYGHGIFATGRDDFSQAFATLLRLEQQCMDRCLELIDSLRK